MMPALPLLGHRQASSTQRHRRLSITPAIDVDPLWRMSSTQNARPHHPRPPTSADGGSLGSGTAEIQRRHSREVGTAVRRSEPGGAFLSASVRLLTIRAIQLRLHWSMAIVFSLKWERTSVSVAIEPPASLKTVSPGTVLLDALHLIDGTRLMQLPVVDCDQVLRLLTRERTSTISACVWRSRAPRGPDSDRQEVPVHAVAPRSAKSCGRSQAGVSP